MTAKVTPMMQQYMEVKKCHPHEILFFRLGDFYEMFLEDAEIASRELEITLTGRGAGLPDKIPMCGIPYHAAESYITKLTSKGYKVAICEQIGDPKAAKGIVKREVIKIITPGTVLSETALTDSGNNYLALVFQQETKIALAGTDISTGECFYTVYDGDGAIQNLLDQLYRLLMPELIIVGELSWRKQLQSFVEINLPRCSFTDVAEPVTNMAILQQHFCQSQWPPATVAQQALATLLNYLHQTVKTDLSQINRLQHLDAGENLVMDTYTLRNLEITRNLRDGGKKGTLLSVLDFTKTAMGSRLLKKWLEYPLLSIGRINDRQAAISELIESFAMRQELQAQLQEIYDFERILTRIEVGSANARDLLALKVSLQCLPAIKAEFATVTSVMLRQTEQKIAVFSDITQLLDAAITESPGFSLREGGLIKSGYSTELDELRLIAKDSRSLLQQMEQQEKETTGIKSLKIGYNKVFGYYIEVTHTNTAAVPAYYIRKQTLANAERYITPELKEFETKILGAQEKIVSLEYRLFVEVRDQIKQSIEQIQQTAQQIAIVDVLSSLAQAATEYNYVRPQITANAEIIIKDGRHPLVERLLERELFVPNDTVLNHQDSEIMIITGPNMAGKSTYMRQTALLTLMAQVGSFIPAREAWISPVDRIFTRIGASDDLTSGQSTFMVEMNEVSQILQYATQRSLIILDEIGRGTSTFDGMSIAKAVIEHIRSKIGAKTLFATHYHELTDLESYDGRIKNYSVAVKERGSEVVFLRRIVAGGADKSYGIHVAKLAGLPKSVTERAKQILKELETQQLQAASLNTSDQVANVLDAPTKAGGMASLFSNSLESQLLSLDVMSITPLEALNILYKLQQQAKDEAGKL